MARTGSANTLRQDGGNMALTKLTKKNMSMRIPKAASELEKRKENIYVKGILAQQVNIYSRDELLYQYQFTLLKILIREVS